MKRPAPAERLAADLEAALVRELHFAYDHISSTHFKRALKRADLRLSDSIKRLGQWNPEKRTIEISRSLVCEHPWSTVLEVLKHEMAHQYVHEVLGRCDETSHGPSFREVCDRIGVDPRASGVPQSSSASDSADGDIRILERISGLLALAQSANVNEAQAAMSAAQRLMLRYNLEAAIALPHRGYGYRHVGVPTGRVSESERLISVILNDHFFVEVIWIPVFRPLENKRGQVLEICGTPANLEMAAYVHAFLTSGAERLWQEHKRAMGITSNRDRRGYLAGVMEGFREKLEREGKKHEKEGLVWVGDADLTAFYRKRHPYVRHTRTAGERRTAAHSYGRDAGRRLVLHRGMAGQASTQSGRRLLLAHNS
jgi:predicted SprT family Zn-dependent metalloprotease